MVGHDAPSMNDVSLAIKVQKCSLDELGDRGVGQVPVAMAHIKYAFDALATFLRRVCFGKVFEVTLHALEQCGGQAAHDFPAFL